MNFIKILFIIFFFIFNVNANESLNIRYIDIDFLFKNSLAGKKINDNLNNEKKS